MKHKHSGITILVGLAGSLLAIAYIAPPPPAEPSPAALRARSRTPRAAAAPSAGPGLLLLVAIFGIASLAAFAFAIINNPKAQADHVTGHSYHVPSNPFSGPYSPLAGATYADVSSSQFFSDELGYLIDRGVLPRDYDFWPYYRASATDVTSYCQSPGEFCANFSYGGMSRALYVVWVARALNRGNDPVLGVDTGTYNGYFTDVDAATHGSEPWYPHLVYLLNHPEVGPTALDYGGYTGGMTDNRFDARRPTRRAWAAVLIRHAFQFDQLGDSDSRFQEFLQDNGNRKVGNWVNLINGSWQWLYAYQIWDNEVVDSIELLKSVNITNGHQNCPNPVGPPPPPDPITCTFSPSGSLKLQVMALLARAMWWGEVSGTVLFPVDPPTCTIGPATHEVLDDDTRIEITLANPNRQDMSIDLANYTIERSWSPDNQLAVDALAVVGNPSVIAAGGEAVLYSTPQAIDQNGNYDVAWEIEASIGTENWTTTGGDIQTTGGDPCQSNLRIVYRPFIKVFYGGLAAGGNFGTSNSSAAPCGDGFASTLGGDRTATAHVAGHAEVTPAGDPRGSSVEYALQANNMIGEFYSASQRVADPQPLKGLTLGNNDNLHDYGGNFGRKACIANYWRLVERLELSTKPSPLTLDLKTELESNERRRYELLAGEQLELSASAPLDGLKATLYIEGDVLISDNIIAGDSRWYDPSEIGYLSIIVRGNIDIAADVTEINALLVAYPKVDTANDVVDGRIRTCWDPVLTDPTSPPNIHFHTCDKQLVINGALIAEKVLFGRVHTSVKQEAPPSLTTSKNNNFNILDINRSRLCQLALDTYPTDTDINSWDGGGEDYRTQFVKYSADNTGPWWSPGVPSLSVGWWHWYLHHRDTSSSLSACKHVGYLLETNVLRGAEDACNGTTTAFCWGNSGPPIDMGRYATPMSDTRLQSEGLVTGVVMARYPKKYSSDSTVTRGRFAMWLARALNGGLDPVAPPVGTPNPFTDVSDTDAFWPHVYYLANHPNVDFRTLGKWQTALATPQPPALGGGSTTERIDKKSLHPNPTEFYPNDNTTVGWAAVVLAGAFQVPDARAPVRYAYSKWYTDNTVNNGLFANRAQIILQTFWDDYKLGDLHRDSVQYQICQYPVPLNLCGQQSILTTSRPLSDYYSNPEDAQPHDSEIREALYGIHKAEIHLGVEVWCGRNRWIRWVEVIEDLNSIGNLRRRNFFHIEPPKFPPHACYFGTESTRKTVLAQMLAGAMAWSAGIRSSGGSSQQYVRTTVAAEVINLLPEYLIGIPELPLFGDQFYKTDSSSLVPVNF